MKEHTLFPVIPEGAFDRHKDPFEIFLEAHKEKDWDQTAFEWTFSDEDEKTCEELKFRSIHNTEILSEYLSKLDDTYRRLLNGDVKSAENAIALMRGFMWGCKSGVMSFFGVCPAEEAEKEAAYLAEKIDDLFEYFAKLATDADKTPQTLVPSYKQELVNAGHTKDDGVTVLTTLSKVAQFLDDKGVAVTGKLLKQFKQVNGKLYSQKAIDEALSEANCSKASVNITERRKPLLKPH